MLYEHEVITRHQIGCKESVTGASKVPYRVYEKSPRPRMRLDLDRLVVHPRQQPLGKTSVGGPSAATRPARRTATGWQRSSVPGSEDSAARAMFQCPRD